MSNAVFSGSRFIGAKLLRVDMTSATWTGVSFAMLRFTDCNLECLNLPAADFTDADLRGCLLRSRATLIPHSAYQ